MPGCVTIRFSGFLTYITLCNLLILKGRCPAVVLLSIPEHDILLIMTQPGIPEPAERNGPESGEVINQFAGQSPTTITIISCLLLVSIASRMSLLLSTVTLHFLMPAVAHLNF